MIFIAALVCVLIIIASCLLYVSKLKGRADETKETRNNSTAIIKIPSESVASLETKAIPPIVARFDLKSKTAGNDHNEQNELKTEGLNNINGNHTTMGNDEKDYVYNVGVDDMEVMSDGGYNTKDGEHVVDDGNGGAIDQKKITVNDGNSSSESDPFYDAFAINKQTSFYVQDKGTDKYQYVTTLD